MSFRSLLADLVLSGTLSNAYEIAGTFTVGQVGGVSIVIDGVRDAILFYNAAGNLLASLAPAPGSDTSGNSWVTGLRVGQAGNPGVVVSVASDGKSGLLYFPGTVADVVIDAHLQLNQQGAGDAQVSFLTIGAATDQTQNDTAFINLFASSKDGTQTTHVTLTYQDPTGGVHSYVVVDPTGAAIKAGYITAVQPGTGTSRSNVAVAETWHDMTLNSPFANGPSPFAPARYARSALYGGNAVALSGTVTPSAGTGTFVVVATLPAGYLPSFGQHFAVATKTAAGANSTQILNITNTGQVELANTAAAGDVIYFDGVVYILN